MQFETFPVFFLDTFLFKYPAFAIFFWGSAGFKNDDQLVLSFLPKSFTGGGDGVRKRLCSVADGIQLYKPWMAEEFEAHNLFVKV